MASFVFVVFLLPLAYAAILSRSPAMGSARNSALNPLLLFQLFIVLSMLDFASIALTGSGKLGGHTLQPNPETLTLLATEYAAMLMAMLIGAGIVFAHQRRQRPKPVRTVNLRGVLLIAYIVVLGFWLLAMSAYSSHFFSIKSSIEIRYETRSDATVYILSLMLLPGITYALCRQSYKVAVPLLLVTLALVFFSGARTRMLYAIIPFAFYLVKVRYWNLSRRYFWILAALFVGLSVASSNLRLELSRNHAVSNPFDSNDLSFAETNIALSRIPRHDLNRYPGEDLVSFATAPFPRSLVPFKPLSGTVQFTKNYDATRWGQTGSGLTIGAINEIEYDYPYPVALIIVGLFGAAWAYGFLKAQRSSTIHGFAWTVALYVFLYNFFRNDLFITGGAIAVFAAYGGIVQTYRASKLTASAHQQRSSRGQLATRSTVA